MGEENCNDPTCDLNRQGINHKFHGRTNKISSRYAKQKKNILIGGAILFAFLGLEIALDAMSDENINKQEKILECKTWWKSDMSIEICLVSGKYMENCPKIETDGYGKKFCVLGEKTYQEFLEP